MHRAGKIESVNTYLALCPVVIGIIIATGTEPLFHLYGFIVCVAATAARAFKSVLQVRCPLALQRDQNPIHIHTPCVWAAFWTWHGCVSGSGVVALRRGPSAIVMESERTHNADMDTCVGPVARLYARSVATACSP